MEMKLLKESIKTGQRVAAGAAEQPIESDLFLPDYYESVARILKCGAVCAISRQNMMGDRLSVEGQVFVTIVYAPETRNTPRTVSTVLPFTKMIELKGDLSAAYAEVTPKLDYLNCRLMSSRRLDIKGAFSLQYELYSDKEEMVVTGTETPSLQLRGCTRKMHLQGATERKQFTVREELDPANIENSDTVLNMRCYGEITDCKQVSGKLVLKGNIRLRVYYEREDGTLGTGDYVLPVSQIMDTAAGDSDTVSAAMNILHCEIQQEDGEEFPILKTEITAEFLISVVTEMQATLCEDAYDLKHEIELTTIPIRYTTLSGVQDETIHLKCKAPMPERAAEVLFTISEVQGITADREETRINFRIPVKHTVIYRDDTGELLQFERTEEGGWSAEVGREGEILARPINAAVTAESFSPDGAGGIDIKAEIRFTCAIMKTGQDYEISDIAAGEEKTPNSGGALVIYYPDDNESLWEVAKRFSSTMQAVREENELEGDRRGAGMMLMIPSLQ